MEILKLQNIWDEQIELKAGFENKPASIKSRAKSSKFLVGT